MAVRLSKCLLLASIALFYTLIVFNNTSEYNTNYQFVRHVLAIAIRAVPPQDQPDTRRSP